MDILFYDTSHLNLSEIISIFYDYEAKASRFEIEIIDVNLEKTSLLPTGLNYNDFIWKLEPSCEFLIVYRKNGPFVNDVEIICQNTVGNVDYQMWLYLPTKYLKELIDNYKLNLI